MEKNNSEQKYGQSIDFIKLASKYGKKWTKILRILRKDPKADREMLEILYGNSDEENIKRRMD